MARPLGSETPRTETILAAAYSAFLRDGFSATSIEGLAQEAGVSKATIYRHFDSKLSILETVVSQATRQAQTVGIFAGREAEPTKKVLAAFAESFLLSMRSDDVVSMFRLIISESSRTPELGVMFFKTITRVAAEPLTEFIAQRVSSKHLKPCNPTIAAYQFIGSIKEPLFWPRLMGVELSDLPYNQKDIVRSATEMFCARYE